MPWPTSSAVTAIDLIDLLETEINGFNLPQVVGAMDNAYDAAEGVQAGYGANLVAKIEDYVSKIQSYDTQIDADAANAGLKKADVLEWFGDASSSGKLAGLRDERKRYVLRIMRILGLEDLSSNPHRCGRILRA